MALARSLCRTVPGVEKNSQAKDLIVSTPTVRRAAFAAVMLIAAPLALYGADIADREAVNPGLGPCPPSVARDTPVHAWRSFLEMGAAGRYSLAAHVLDLSEVPESQQRVVGEEVARKLYLTLVALHATTASVEDSTPEGPVVGGIPQNVVVPVRFRHDAASGEVWLRRTRDVSTGDLLWLFTRQTVSNATAWYRALTAGEAEAEETPLNVGLGQPPSSVHRGNPRATVAGFLRHARDGAFDAAAHYLDLGDFPPDQQAAAGRRLARRLMLALLRSGIVDPDVLSNDEYGAPEAGVDDDEEVLAETTAAGRAATIALTRRSDPALGSVWAFSQTTVSHIDGFYKDHGYGWIGDHLPQVFFAAKFAGLQLWQWSVLAVVLVVGGTAARLLSSSALRLFGALASRSSARWDDEVVRALDGPLGLVFWALIVAVATPVVGMSDAAQNVMGRGWRVLLLFGLGWILFRIIDLAALGLTRRATARGSLGQSFIPIMGRIGKVLIFVFVLLAALDVIGVQVVGLLAGLGLGGLAVAFAAQKTLENLFGAIAIAGDRPFKVGDWVTIGGISGTVEDVGLRSTRLRPLDRTLVSIPNGVVMGEKIVNFGERDRILYRTTIGIVYGTTADQLSFIIDEIKRMLMTHPLIHQEAFRVRFGGFGPSALEIEIVCWVLTKEFHAYTAVAEELNFAIMRIVERAGTSFAFPTQTIHFARDERPDQALRAAIGAEVEGRRQRGELSIPEPLPDIRERLQGKEPQ